MSRRLALGATSACLVSVLMLVGFSPWMALALVLILVPGLGIVMALVDMGVQEIQGRRKLKEQERS